MSAIVIYHVSQPTLWETWGPILVGGGGIALGAGLWRLAVALGRLTAIVDANSAKLARIEAAVFPIMPYQLQWAQSQPAPPQPVPTVAEP